LPTYEYRCLSCEHQFERVQRISEDPLKECEVCGATVKRLLFPVAIHFKGSGFYSTDYARRGMIGPGTPNPGNGNGSEDSSAKTSDTSEKDSAKTPAPTGASSESASTAGKSD